METYFDLIPKELNYLIGIYLDNISDIHNFCEYLNIGCGKISWYSYFKEYLHSLNDEFYFYWILNFDPSIKDIKFNIKYKWEPIVTELIIFKFDISKIDYLSPEDKKEQILSKYFSVLSQYKVDEIIDSMLKDYSKEELNTLFYNLCRFDNTDYVIFKFISRLRDQPYINWNILAVSLLSDNPNTSGYIIDNFDLGAIPLDIYQTFILIANFHGRSALAARLLFNPMYKNLQTATLPVQITDENLSKLSKEPYDSKYKIAEYISYYFTGLQQYISDILGGYDDPTIDDDTFLYFSYLTEYIEQIWNVLVKNRNYIMIKKLLLFPKYREKLKTKIQQNLEVISKI